MNRISKLSIGLFAALSMSTSILPFSANAHEIPDCSVNCAAPVIQIALLLDTSNSMDGLIAQTKSQLWMLVNELGETQRSGITPQIELGLYEYGNSDISVSQGYIRQVMSLTTDLDGVSEKLFALKTNGGQEYAGQVISTAVEDLEWSDDPADMKLVIIAGNEPFTQGPVNFRTACEQARKKGVIIDTIHCGNEDTGIDTKWKAGADCGGGIYMTINQDEVAAFVPSPYDDDILKLNQKLNETYLGYGSKGASNAARQVMQDSNAASMGIASEISRAKTKSSKQYDNSGWDIVDAYKSSPDKFSEITESELPKELQGKTDEEKKSFVEGKVKEREDVSSKIAKLEKLRSEYVDAKRSEDTDGKTLEDVVVAAVRKQAADLGFE